MYFFGKKVTRIIEGILYNEHDISSIWTTQRKRFQIIFYKFKKYEKFLNFFYKLGVSRILWSNIL